MKKVLSLFLATILIACTFVGCSSQTQKTQTDLEYIQSKGTLVVGITDYAPMNYKEEGSTEWTGFDTEFAELVGEKLGVTVQFIEINWDNKYSELDAKSIDCIWNGMTITEEGKLNASISNAYVENAQVVVMAKDKLASYTDADSVKDLKFAVEAGSAGADAVKDAGFANVVEVSAQSDALLEVKSGSVDACVIDITMANAMTGEGTSYSNLGYSLKLTSEEYGVAFRKDSDMTAKFNELMATMMADGTLDTLAQKYDLTLIK